ncbi:hypothetical protein AJ79_09763 [Helicocarpus griseus UAMH5409]|uniref:F-box domain-containing protein n=1 Tax=Helicocarpus griseus UAMH5409 TaxID=1447875 RepID=A0A2B7WHF9_9EURO|nr:hypothetical protein AJ79_09763 [Helicocarpus griseus UAMH5409]
MIEKSPEILDRIIHYLSQREEGQPDPKIASYASVCRIWQDAVELRTMRSVSVKNADGQWGEFCKVFECRRRRKIFEHLTYIHFMLKTPLYDPRLAETLGEHIARYQREVEKHFEFETRRLFGLLKTWEDDFAAIIEPNTEARLVLDIQLRFSGQTPWWVKFVKGDPLPRLNRIIHLGLNHAHPTAFFKIARGLLSLRHVSYSVTQSDMRVFTNKVNDFRKSFFAGLLNTDPLKQLETIKLECTGPCPRNHNMRVPNFQENSSFDYLSRAEVFIKSNPWGLSQNVFWPCLDSGARLDLSYPDLQYLTFVCGIMHPEQEWYLSGDRETTVAGYVPQNKRNLIYDGDFDDYSLEPYEWRHKPLCSTFYPMLEAIGRAVLAAPRLRRFEFALRWNQGQEILVEFLAPGVATGVQHINQHMPGFDFRNRRRARWYVWTDDVPRGTGGAVCVNWQVPDRIRKIWFEKIKRQGGGGLILQASRPAVPGGKVKFQFEYEGGYPG